MNGALSLKLQCLLLVFLVLLLPSGAAMPREVLAGLLLLVACLDAARGLKETEGGSRLVAEWVAALISPQVLPFYAALIGLAWTGLMLVAPMRVQSSPSAVSSYCGGSCGAHGANTAGNGCGGCGSRSTSSQATRPAASIPVPSAAMRQAPSLPPVLQEKLQTPNNTPSDSALPVSVKSEPSGSKQIMQPITAKPQTPPVTSKTAQP